MTDETQPAADGGAIIEAVVTRGDLALLSPHERTQYYVRVCESVGLNPFTRPLEYITLNGKLRLYALRDAADQLRKINGISIDIVSREVTPDGLCMVHAKARDKTGREDEDYGAVSVAGLKGEALANATLKAITKAKRRVTLSISGLGFLDETEAPEGNREQWEQSSGLAIADLDKFADAPAPPTEADIRAGAESASLHGAEAFTTYWQTLSGAERDLIRPEMAKYERAAKIADDPFGLPPLASEAADAR